MKLQSEIQFVIPGLKKSSRPTTNANFSFNTLSKATAIDLQDLQDML